MIVDADSLPSYSLQELSEIVFLIEAQFFAQTITADFHAPD